MSYWSNGGCAGVVPATWDFLKSGTCDGFSRCSAARFRRERILVVGCGDVGLRSVRALGGGPVGAGARGRVRLLALSSTPGRRDALRAAGLTPLAGNLDDAASLRRLAGLATRVLHLAPPPPAAMPIRARWRWCRRSRVAVGRRRWSMARPAASMVTVQATGSARPGL